MKYIYTNELGTQLGAYFEYINSLENKLPPHVYAFASDPKYYDLISKSSLHDSWIQRIEIIESVQGKSGNKKQTDIHIVLFGAYHDRNIFLKYSRVAAYSFSCNGTREGFGDLLIHELRLDKNEFLVHEIQFENGVILIECKDLSHHEDQL